MSFVQNAKRGVFWTMLQQFSVQGINFIVQILLARFLMPSDFGLIAMISIFVAIGQSLMDSGMSTSLIRNSQNSEKDYGTVFVTNICVSLLIYSVVFVFSPVVAKFYDQEILTTLLRCYAIVFVINSFVAVQTAKFSKELQFKKQFAYQLPSTIVGACIGISLAAFGFGVWSIVWMNISQSFTFALTLWVISKWRPSFVFDRRIFLHHFNFGYKLTLSGLLNTLYLNLYKIIIGKNFSPASVGFFTHADSIRLFPVNQLSSILNKVTFPLFANIQDDIKLKAVYVSAMRLVLSISSALMLCLMISAEPLFLLVFGEKWLPSVNYFQILCLASIFLPIGTYNLNILKIKGRSDVFFKVEVIKKVIGVIALICSVSYGIEAMVWTLCLTNIFFAFLNGHYSGKFISYPVKEQIVNALEVVSIASIPAIIAYYMLLSINQEFTIHNFFQVLFTCSAYFAIYAPLVFIFNRKLVGDLKLIIKK